MIKRASYTIATNNNYKNKLKEDKKQAQAIRDKTEQYKKSFSKKWHESKPQLNNNLLISALENDAKKLTPKLLKIVFKSLAISNAVNFVNDALKDNFNSPQTNMAISEINTLSNKLSRIEILRLLMSVFNMKKDVKLITQLMIEREFNKPQTIQQNMPSINRMLYDEKMRNLQLEAPSPKVK